MKKEMRKSSLRRLSVAVVCATVAALSACKDLDLYSETLSPVIATVGTATLREADIEDIYSGVIYSEDSVVLRTRAINDWVLGEVKMQAALREAISGSIDESVVDRMVGEYRKTLLIHSLESNYLSEAIDTTVSDTEIMTYYNEHKEAFKLAGPLVKAIVVRMPEGLRQSQKLEKMFLTGSEEELSDFLNICAKNNYRAVDMRESWVEFSSVLRHIPFGYTDFDSFLSKNSNYEITDNEYKYMLRVVAYLPTGSLSPLDREKSTITKIIRNLRHGEAIKTFNDSLLVSAEEQQLITIQ